MDYSGMEYMFMDPTQQEEDLDTNEFRSKGSDIIPQSIKAAMASFFNPHSINQSKPPQEMARVAADTGVNISNSETTRIELENKNMLIEEYRALYNDYKMLFNQISTLKSTYDNKKSNTHTITSNTLTRSIYSVLVAPVIPTIIYSDIDRRSEISFISSVLEQACDLEDCLVDTNEENSLLVNLGLAIENIKSSHILLIGASFYIHQRIKSEYLGKEVTSTLFKILDALLSDVAPDKRTLALNHLESVVLASTEVDYDSDEEEFNECADLSTKLPINRGTLELESIEIFKTNVENILTSLSQSSTPSYKL